LRNRKATSQRETNRLEKKSNDYQELLSRDGTQLSKNAVANCKKRSVETDFQLYEHEFVSDDGVSVWRIASATSLSTDSGIVEQRVAQAPNYYQRYFGPLKLKRKLDLEVLDELIH